MVTKREIPYPFSALFAMSNDADSYFDVTGDFSLLATRHKLFADAGLVCGDSVFYGASSGQVAERDKYIKCGWIDSMHAWTYKGWYLDDAQIPTRDEILAQIADFNSRGYGAYINNFLDHGFYFSPDSGEYLGIGRQFVSSSHSGDYPSSIQYFADHGVPATPYIWAGDYGIGDVYPKRTPPTGSGYSIPVGDFLYASDLRDGTKAWFFDRLSDAEYIDSSILGQIAAEGGVCIKYAESNFSQDLNPIVTAIAAAQNSGSVLHARSADVLDYCRAWRGVQWDESANNINVTLVVDPQRGNFVPTLKQLRGITFMVDYSPGWTLSIDGVQVDDSEIVRGTDNSIGFKWHLHDIGDYSVSSPVANLVDVQAAFEQLDTEVFRYDLRIDYYVAEIPIGDVVEPSIASDVAAIAVVSRLNFPIDNPSNSDNSELGGVISLEASIEAATAVDSLELFSILGLSYDLVVEFTGVVTPIPIGNVLEFSTEYDSMRFLLEVTPFPSVIEPIKITGADSAFMRSRGILSAVIEAVSESDSADLIVLPSGAFATLIDAPSDSDDSSLLAIGILVAEESPEGVDSATITFTGDWMRPTPRRRGWTKKTPYTDGWESETPRQPTFTK